MYALYQTNNKKDMEVWYWEAILRTLHGVNQCAQPPLPGIRIRVCMGSSAASFRFQRFPYTSIHGILNYGKR